MTTPRKPRLIDMLPDKTGRMSRRRRALVTQDGTTIARDAAQLASCIGESFPIAGVSVALDARPPLNPATITFDGAVPSIAKSKDIR